MKYIRTDSFIYNIKDGRKWKITSKKELKVLWRIGWAECGKIICKSDSIEELCDEFVLFIDNKPYAIVPNKKYNAKLAHDVWKDYRGAIWTDKGLIYVAKMNEKGCLELL